MGVVAAGDTGSLIELMETTSSGEGRDHILKCFMQAPADARARVSECHGCVTSLHGWLVELLADGCPGATAELILKARAPAHLWPL